MIIIKDKKKTLQGVTSSLSLSPKILTFFIIIIIVCVWPL